VDSHNDAVDLGRGKGNSSSRESGRGSASVNKLGLSSVDGTYSQSHPLHPYTIHQDITRYGMIFGAASA
jgi:hypothetical protein